MLFCVTNSIMIWFLHLYNIYHLSLHFILCLHLGCTDMPFLATFGVQHASDIDTSMTRRTPVSKRCPFFSFFSLLRHDVDTVDMPAVKKKGKKKRKRKRKSQILTYGQIITVNFVKYPKTKTLKPTAQPSL